ncbi:hypothetical protein C9J85_15355 [Haloferax sp. wsp5]|nr:hypothetical protein C9J85_15355 [Haloferax sp. wsp5]
MFTVGDTGSGKSFGAKENFIRSIEQSKDRIGIILEPLKTDVLRALLPRKQSLSQLYLSYMSRMQYMAIKWLV